MISFGFSKSLSNLSDHFSLSNIKSEINLIDLDSNLLSFLLVFFLQNILLSNQFLNHITVVDNSIGNSALERQRKGLNVDLSAVLNGNQKVFRIILVCDRKFDDRVDQFSSVSGVPVADPLVNVVSGEVEFARLGDHLDAVHDGWLVEKVETDGEIFIVSFHDV